MKYKAVFFDRDGTLTYGDPEILAWRDKAIEGWSGKPFSLSYERMMGLFQKASGGDSPWHAWYKNIDEERDFYKRYYVYLLRDEGVDEDVEARAKLLFDALWCNNNLLPYPETLEVLEYFQGKGYQMGVISDTSPSLELTLRQAGLARYFTSFTAASLVGAGKPSPIIFGTALAAQNVSAPESLYVDDYDVEADGARELGFTSFHLDRKNERSGQWVIHSLTGLIDYVEKR